MHNLTAIRKRNDTIIKKVVSRNVLPAVNKISPDKSGDILFSDRVRIQT